METEGKTPSSKTLSYKIIEPTFKESQALELKDNERVLRMERLRLGDGEPICLETTTVSAKLIQGIKQVDVTESFYRSLEVKKGIIPASAKQYISAILANDRVAKMLAIKPGDPILKLKQISYLKKQNHLNLWKRSMLPNGLSFILINKRLIRLN